MKGEKLKMAKGKLVWGLVAVLALVSLGASVGYYVKVLHGKQVEVALQGKHFTLSLETGKLLEEEVQQAKEEKTEAAEAETVEEVEETEKVAKAEEGHAEEAKPAMPTQDTATEETHADSAATTPSKEQAVATEKKPDAVATTATSNAESANPNVQKVAAVVGSNAPKIVLIISGLGLSRSSTERALTLPAGVTLGFSPYSLDIKQWVASASKDGHDILLNLPLEAGDIQIDDPGSFALVSNLDAENNLKRLDWVLTRTEGFVGVYSDPNEKFTEIQSSTRPVLKDLQKRGIALVYGAGYSNNSVLQLAKDVNEPIIVNDVVVDAKISADRIQEGLEALEFSAKRNGYAVGMGAPYPITIKVIEQWIPTLKEKGIELVPVSVLLNKQNDPKNKT